jgi:Protein of unknown function (DUF1573)
LLIAIYNLANVEAASTFVLSMLKNNVTNISFNTKFKIIMKKVLFLFAFVLMAAVSYGQGKIAFKTEKHDFGKVEEGVTLSHDYEFTNTGSVPVVISNVQPSCGCTTPFWTKEPIMPGKTGKVTASFNTVGRGGNQNKTLTVLSNSEVPSITLSFSVQVEPKAVKTNN